MFAQSMSPRGSLSECRADRLSPIAGPPHARQLRFKYIRHFDRTSFDDLERPGRNPCPERRSPGRSGVPADLRPPEGLTRLPAARSGVLLLSRDQEAHLFRQMNYLKSRANRIKEGLDPQWPGPRDLDQIEQLESEGSGAEEPDRRNLPWAGRLHRQDTCQGRLRVAR